MTARKHKSTEKLIGASYEAMDKHAQKVARHISERKHISKLRPVAKRFDMPLVFANWRWGVYKDFAIAM